jgi:hypothetical protein
VAALLHEQMFTLANNGISLQRYLLSPHKEFNFTQSRKYLAATGFVLSLRT